MEDKVWLKSPVTYLKDWNKARKNKPHNIIKADDYSFPIMVDLYNWQQAPIKLQTMYPFGQYQIRVDTHRDFGTVYWVHMHDLMDASSKWYNADGELVRQSIAGNRYTYNISILSLVM